MANALADQIARKIGQVAELYYRLILAVAPSGAGKTVALKEVHKSSGWPLVNVNLELSRRMLDLSERQRTLQLPRLLSEIVNALPVDVVLLDNIEMLFNVSLKTDPLRLLQNLSKNKTIVAAWNGTIESNHLIYAEPGHPEYKRYPLHDFTVVGPEVPE